MEQETTMDFIHLHTRSLFSRGESICSPQGLLSLARRYGQTSLALTDRNVLAGHPEFHSQAWIKGVNPMLGMELLVDNHSHLEDPGIHSAIYPLVLLARDEAGYQNLVRLSNIAQLHAQGDIKRVSREMLAVYSQGLVALSGGLEGEISQSYLKNKPEHLKAVLESHLDIFGKDHFFLELQERGDPFDTELNRFLVSTAQKYQLKYVATADVRYLEPSHHQAFQIYRQHVQADEPGDIPDDSFSSSWLRSTREMLEAFRSLPDALSNTLLVTDMCQYNLKLKPDYPPVDVPANISSQQYLADLCATTLSQLFPDSIPREYQARLESELNTIHCLGLAWYFILLRRVMHYPLARNIQISGGSANSSLVCYLSGISPLDPLRYGLVFDLWSGIAPVPIHSVSIEARHRNRFIHWIKRLVGEDKVNAITDYADPDSLTPFKISGEFLQIPRVEINSLLQALKEHPSSDLSPENLKDLREIQQIRSRPGIVYQKWAEAALALSEALTYPQEQASSHLVLSGTPQHRCIPLYLDTGKSFSCAQFDVSFLRSQGFLTLTVQGITGLEQISRCFDRIRVHPVIQVRPEDISLQDQPTWEMLSYGETLGIFGFDDRRTAGLLSRFRPACLDDLALVYACSQPGKDGLLGQIIANRDNPELKRDFDPAIDHILSDTYGVMIYQEQLYRVLHTLSGCSHDTILKMMRSFLLGDTAYHGPVISEWNQAVRDRGKYREEALQDILDYCLSRAPLLSSKAEALDIAWIGYLSAWFKTHHYAVFMQEVQRCQWTAG